VRTSKSAKNRFRTLWLLLLVLNFGLPSALAQSGWGSEVQDFAGQFAKKYLAAQNREDAEALSAYLTRDVTVAYSSISLNGQKKVFHGDWRDFLKTLETQQIDTVSQRQNELRGVKYDGEVGNFAIVLYQVDYEILRNKIPHTKGVETVTLVCRKVDTEWLVVDFKSVSIETERFRGPCQCEVFSSEADKFTSKTVAPNGKSYQSHLYEFEFALCDHRNQIYTIKVGKNAYKWLISGEVYLLATPDDCTVQPTTPIGLAANRLEAVRIIVEKHLLVANCSSVTLKK
jgi:ketosteroid isomerase-like protein